MKKNKTFYCNFYGCDGVTLSTCKKRQGGINTAATISLSDYNCPFCDPSKVLTRTRPGSDDEKRKAFNRAKGVIDGNREKARIDRRKARRRQRNPEYVEVCTVPRCGRPHYAKGLCLRCYNKQKWADHKKTSREGAPA